MNAQKIKELVDAVAFEAYNAGKRQVDAEEDYDFITVRKEARTAIDALQAERDTYRDGLGACKGIIVGLQAERDALQETVQGLTQGLEKQGWEVKELRAQLEAAQKDYNELIFCVSQKFKGETRHQTAKRYLLSWEGRSNNAGQAIAATKGTTE